MGEKSLIEQRLERIATTIKCALRGNYSEISEIYEPFEALGGGIVGPSSVPVEVFRLWPADYSSLLNDAPSKYVVEIVAGAFARARSGAVRSVEIRTPISVVEDNSYNESFVQACCRACDEIHAKAPELKCNFDIKLLNGYTMAFFLIPEEFFLGLSPEQQHECLVNYVGVVEDCASFIRNAVEYFGY